MDIKIMCWKMMIISRMHSVWALLNLTHWGRVTHIWVSKLTIIVSDNGLAPSRRQAIIWTNAGILSIGPLGTNVSEILIEILTFSSKKMRMKVSSAKRRPFCLGLNVLAASFCMTKVRLVPSSQYEIIKQLVKWQCVCGWLDAEWVHSLGRDGNTCVIFHKYKKPTRRPFCAIVSVWTCRVLTLVSFKINVISVFFLCFCENNYMAFIDMFNHLVIEHISYAIWEL